MPTEAVKCTDRPSAWRNLNARSLSQMRSATKTAPSRPVSGKITENSSPPNRATTSVSRAQLRMTAAASTSALLPDMWPWFVLTFLKPSMSMNNTDRGRPLRSDRFSSRRSTRFR